MAEEAQNKNHKKREIDLIAQDANAWVKKDFVFIAKTRIKTWKAFSILAFVSGIAAGSILLVQINFENQSRAEAISYMMQKMKTRGCIADGLLTGSGGDTSGSIALIERSKCEYLHRAVETWTIPPDFNLVSQNMKQVKKTNLIYGMFLAEAIGINSEYFYPDEKRNFNFSAMCRPGSEGFWGKGTCKAYFGSLEYRKYIRYITEKAIDLDIQSFLFGQIYFQDNSNLSKNWAKDVVAEMRKYAHSKGKEIIVGAQTNDIGDEKYLRLFDYIEGGVGEDDQGNLENGPCLSRWWKKTGDRCWALLWHDYFAPRANNVLLHLDWSGLSYDDMSRFSRMDKSTRAKTLKNLYQFAASKNMGFLMPYLAVKDDQSGGCFGPKADYYSPDDRYSCKDEDVITAIFQGSKIGNDAKFLDQSIPATMTSGKEYQVSVSVENTGTENWSAEKKYRLGSQNPQDSDIWGSRIYLGPDEIVQPGQTKIFNFSVKAPKEPGIYNFQWKMLQEDVEWFGSQSENIEIAVNQPS